MGQSIRIGRIFGIQIALHPSWFVIFLIVTYTMAAGELPRVFKTWDEALYWIVGAVISLLFAIGGGLRCRRKAHHQARARHDAVLVVINQFGVILLIAQLNQLAVVRAVHMLMRRFFRRRRRFSAAAGK